MGTVGNLERAEHGFVDQAFELADFDRVGIVELLDRGGDPRAGTAFVAHPRHPDTGVLGDDAMVLAIVGEDRGRTVEGIALALEPLLRGGEGPRSAITDRAAW
jgi:hypothetical protein